MCVNLGLFCVRAALRYEQGRWALVERDLATVLPRGAAAAAAAAMAPAAVAAFDARREAINFKKVCLRLFNDGRVLERGGPALVLETRVSDVDYDEDDEVALREKER